MKTKILIFFTSILLVQCTTDKIPERPNIIFIMTDDHAYQAISAYESGLIQTPNIDRLANEGMLFKQAFVTNSICAPSRAVLLTGKFSHMNGLRDNHARFDSSQQTFPKILQAAGYQTAVVGKWHLKSNPTGFDHWDVLPGQGDYYNPEFKSEKGNEKIAGYVNDIITQKAIKWIQKAKSNEQPFMLMYHHKAPHRSWQPPLDKLDEILSRNYQEPSTLYDTYDGRGKAAKEAEMRINDHMSLSLDNKLKPELVAEMSYPEFYKWYPSDYEWIYNKFTEEQKETWDAAYKEIQTDFKKKALKGHELISWKYQRYMQDYLGCIESVDNNIGELLAFLESEGLDNNTVIIYTSDQGFYLGEHGWFDKRFMYEESFRTPLLVRWPGEIVHGSENDALVQNIDFAQTILDIAGVDAPSDMQGKSLLPLLLQEPIEWRDAIYYQYFEYPGIHAVKRHYGIRTNRYKLIHFYYDIDEWELYDLEKDPQEMKNRYNDPAYFGIRDELHLRLNELQVEYQDSDSLRKEILANDLTIKN